MSLAYAADLVLLDRSSRSRASVEAVAALVADWAGVDPLVEGEQAGRRNAQVRIEMMDTGEATVWDLRLSHPDTIDSSLRWNVAVTLVSREQLLMATRLEQYRTDGAVIALRTEPRPPGCIREVIESSTVVAVDGQRDLTSDVWVVRPEDAELLANLVLHPERRLPIVAFTPRDDDVFDGGILAESLPGLAHVVFVSSATSWSLQDSIPRGFAVYGGAVRIWWPGISSHTPETAKWSHQLWPGDVSARQIAEHCLELITTAGSSSSAIDSQVAEIRAEIRGRELRRLRAEVEAAVQSSEARRFEQELTQFEEIVRSYEAEAAEAQGRADRAERDRDFWRSESARLRGLLPTGQVVERADEDDEFTRELTVEINRRGVVDGARPRLFAFGSRFLATVESHGDRYRAKILKTCADVVLGAPQLLARIEDHVLRSGEGANDPPVRRGRDQAVAHRCYIEQNTPAARRLHYWLRSDGSVEFASANVHDDASIPDV